VSKPNSKEKELYEHLVKHFEAYGIKSTDTSFKIMYEGKDSDGDDFDLSLTLYNDRYETEWDYDSDEGYYDEEKRNKEIEVMRIDNHINSLQEQIRSNDNMSIDEYGNIKDEIFKLLEEKDKLTQSEK